MSHILPTIFGKEAANCLKLTEGLFKGAMFII